MSMVQLGLHTMCCNHCDFCLLKSSAIDTIDKVISEIKKAKENIKYIASSEENWTNKYRNGISILGGEIYYIKNEEYKNEFLSLIDTVIEYILLPNKDYPVKFSTVTNGMYDPEWMLFPVIDKIVNAVGIEHVDVNFSYDFKYRFHTEESRLLCESTINRFHERYNYKCGIQMIVTQDVVDKYINGWRTKDLVNEKFPGNMICFLYPHPINRGNGFSGAMNLPGFNFTRKSFITFIQLLKTEEPEIFESFLYSTRNSAVFKYTMLYTKLEDGDEKQSPVLSDGKEVINKNCNHSELYKCYADCEDCMLCDLESIL